MRTTRYHGLPEDDPLPDVGDVMAVFSARQDAYTGTRYRVVSARGVRGREDEPWELSLVLERDDAAVPSPGAHVMPIVWRKR